MQLHDAIERDAAPDRLIAEAITLGRELSVILRGEIGLVDRPDRVAVETCVDKRDDLTPLVEEVSTVCAADRRRDSTPIHRQGVATPIGGLNH